MKQIIIFIFTVGFISNVLSQNLYTPIVTQGLNNLQIVKSDLNEIEGVFSLEDLKAFKVKTKKHGIFTQLVGNGLLKDFSRIGEPMTLVYNKLIEIPEGANVSAKVISYDSTIIKLNDFGLNNILIPTQPSIPKNIDPDELPFEYNKASYKINSFKGSPMIKVERLGKMRGTTIGRLSISPMAYNPVKNELIIFTNISFRIEFKNYNKDKASYEYKRLYSPAFESLFSKTLLNHKDILQAYSIKDDITRYPIKMVIITSSTYVNSLDDFIKWKHQKGFYTIVETTDNIGNTTTAIHNYLQNLYDNATPSDPAPTYVIFIGDINVIPAHYSDAGYTSKYTDLYYCTMDGTNDIYPDMYYGRWSVENLSELSSYIDKTLQYEMYSMPNDAYLAKSVMVAGVDASNASTYGNGQINYACDYYINASHGFTTVYEYLYGSGTPITSDEPRAADSIHAQVSRGVGFVNYTAHCSDDGWADPSFTISDAQSLQNINEYCVMLSNCCQSNKFDVSDAFGEVITNTPNLGCVAHLGASQYSLWDEDYWFAVGATTVSSNPSYDSHLGAYDKIFHDNGEPVNEWYATSHQLIYAGNLAVTESGSNNEQYYWEIYHTMGDPSIFIYMGIPSDLNVSYQDIQVVGTTSLTINTEDYAYVAISNEGTLLDAQYTGSGTSVTLNFTSPTSPDTFDIVITKQFKKPYFGKVYFISPTGPYVSLTSENFDDSNENNNGLCDYGENILIDINLKNVGNQDASNIVAQISTSDQYISITDNIENCGNILAGQENSYAGAFAFTIADSIPDQHVVYFDMIITDDNNNTWHYTFSTTLNAPVLDVVGYSINDSNGNNNGRLDPGETTIINIQNKNIGNSTTPSGTATLSTTYNNITISGSPTTIAQTLSGSSYNAPFTLEVSSSAQIGDVASLSYTWEALPYTISTTFSVPIGEIIEDWEDSNTFDFNWQDDGNATWFRDNTTFYEGAYSMRSGDISDDETSTLYITIDVISPDTLSFFYKVSSEDSYDFLNFYVDGTMVGQWSGEINWTNFSYYIASTGTHVLKWSYEKDYSISDGLDAGWIDFIKFPPISIIYSQDFVVDEINAELNIYPVPAHNNLNISYTLNTPSDVSFEIYDVNGKILEKFGSFHKETGKYLLTKNIKKLKNGTYFIKMKAGNDIYIRKFIKE